MTTSPAFAPYHRSDRNFHLAFLLAAWLGVLMGFVPPLAKRAGGLADFPAPLILHLHAVAFMGWMVLLSAQILLVRAGRTALHRKLGLVGVALIPVMALSGYFAEVYSQRFYLAHPPDSQAFFILPIYYVIAFPALATAALLARRDPPLHKRLLLLATTLIVGAAYARWWGDALTDALGDGFLGFIGNSFTGTHLLLLGAVGYDVATRGRPHPIYWAAVPAILAAELIVSWIYHAPAWLPVAHWIVTG